MKVFVDKVLRRSEVNTKRWQGWAYRILSGDEVITVYTREEMDLEGAFIHLYCKYSEKKRVIEYRFAGLAENIEGVSL